jgi:hypothetical protein
MPFQLIQSVFCYKCQVFECLLSTVLYTAVMIMMCFTSRNLPCPPVHTPVLSPSFLFGPAFRLSVRMVFTTHSS